MLFPTLPTPRLLSQRWRTVASIERHWRELESLADAELSRRARGLAFQVRCGTPADRLRVEAFALAAESIRRETNKRLYPVQIYGGLVLLDGCLAEMQTGEGKTLTAIPAAFSRALAGQGVHVFTANPYLAQRDAHELTPIYQRLGLTVGCVLQDLQDDARLKQYDCDVTYGTASEFGFDFLRDRLKSPPATSGETDAHAADFRIGVQRGHFCALVDEADSILIDEARTPLIIALPTPRDADQELLIRWARTIVPRLQQRDDWVYQPREKRMQLTIGGCQKVLLAPRPPRADVHGLESLFKHVETALLAEHAFRLGRDYTIVEGEVVIVDESTGRLMTGRKWQDGLHQAVEVKEDVELTEENGQAARITIQSYLLRYKHLCGMTGTAWSARRELQRTYKLGVIRIPTHRPCLRRELPPRVFATQTAKAVAIAEEVSEMLSAGRAVLIGSPSIRASQSLGEQLSLRGIPHQILNAVSADDQEKEALMVAQAGHQGNVTIATNMAGRGTDILLDAAVRAAGGLHVIATEIHSSLRIDRQLVGRGARQGDPGSYRFFVSLEDELFQHVPPRQHTRWKARARPNAAGELDANYWLPGFRRIQRGIERRHARHRRQLFKAEKRRSTTWRQIGLDPCLDLTES